VTAEHRLLGYAVVFSGASLVADGWRRVHQGTKEERQMLKTFGEAYRAYRRQVPMFIPRFETNSPQEA
jgi:protein-S-isoprenylcysteine O-methyltransferase Ste14